jgi:porphobilinogen synthase
MDLDLHRRPRRNRKSNSIRDLVQETTLTLNDLITPLFLLNGSNKKNEIETMPGIYRLSEDNILKEIDECLSLGLKNFILFPIIPDELKDPFAKYSHDRNNFYLKTIHKIKSTFPNVSITTDVAMDPYSSVGHDGLVKDGEILNDETLDILGEMALLQAEAGADIIGPSDMMDGRVSYIRHILDSNQFTNVSIMSYTAKYASSFYGPFRDALDSAPKSGDKKTYQMNPANVREALIEGELDYSEGADFLMIKPALAYLDIIHLFKQHFQLPIVAYNVSGEYSMVKFAEKAGILNGRAAMEEILISIKRAGADIIISYFAKEYANNLK